MAKQIARLERLDWHKQFLQASANTTFLPTERCAERRKLLCYNRHFIQRGLGQIENA